ncbi:hypothetical protein DFAR_2230008 [Desulfarculales bacterium]
MDQLGGYLLSANFYNWGEPVMRPGLPELVDLLHRRLVMTMVSSNRNTATLQSLEDLCRAGLDLSWWWASAGSARRSTASITGADSWGRSWKTCGPWRPINAGIP